MERPCIVPPDSNEEQLGQVGVESSNVAAPFLNSLVYHRKNVRFLNLRIDIFSTRL